MLKLAGDRGDGRVMEGVRRWRNTEQMRTASRCMRRVDGAKEETTGGRKMETFKIQDSFGRKRAAGR